MVPDGDLWFLRKKLYDAFVQEEGVDGYRLNQTMKTYDQISQLGVKVAKGQSLINEGYFMWKRRFSNVESPAGFWCSYNTIVGCVMLKSCYWRLKQT